MSILSPSKTMEESKNGAPGGTLLTPQDVARRLQVSVAWVRDHSTRKHPRLQAGTRWRFRFPSLANGDYPVVAGINGRAGGASANVGGRCSSKELLLATAVA
jgi:hypothetical protein